MSTTRLPELPVPHWCMPERMAGEWKVPGAWSSDQMHAYGLAVWKAAMEQAASMCESVKPQNDRSDWTDFAHIRANALDLAAAAIRSLPLPEQGGPQ